MQTDSKFFNVDSSSASSGSSSGIGSGWSTLIEVAFQFGVGYLTAQSEGKKNQALLEQMSALDAQQATKLKALLSASQDESAKTKLIFDFLNQQKVSQLEAETKKKRILPLLGLGFGVILLSLIFYKLHKQNNG